ncbi:molybdopterin molybdotransferase [Herbaspirillum sp. Sphag1AN]|uniref:molybdopterin molybdotransferase MoeA n=1 Tax=unclassified Herbaspirillum TaxID=2624150 RepID=UPI00160DED71|nr:MULTISPECIES: gephyrin-like molybdotransferase Glp [unclassified Herbaspirillum]MBB3212403.1 molybdopterin molybdotransferase [Herbaspirillum sp. Sphag1AN]MBB3245498.1 molybdopterin molybdotransferase [Herbaspirillum sp. Sphag64]
MSTKPTLLSVAAASEFLIQSALPISEIEQVDTLAANGRVLAVPQLAQINVPGMDNSQMDGYAVRTVECHEGVRLRVSQRIPAGHVGAVLEPGTAARIFTGAMVPQGADAIIMQEACEADGDYVTLHQVPAVGEWIRRIGEDIRSGATILPAGVRLRPQELGLAASVGLASLPVRRKVRVAVFFTGDELTMPGQPLAPGAIYNSNRFLLRGLLENLGCEVSDYGIVPDQLQATRETLRAAAARHDLIITSGGVSVGEEDHIKPAVEAEGRLNMWQIAMKPGKPLAFGEVNHSSEGRGGKAFFFGLPGNPVSTFVTFLIFVRPFLQRLQGVEQVAPRVLTLRADFNWPKADRRQEFLRARINANGGLDLFPHQGSAVLTSTVWADGLIDNPAGQTIAAGDLVRFLPFDHLLH